jgi:hypothetical protein
MQAVFEKTANKKLEWFFGDLLSTNKKLDYSIDCIKHADSLTHIMKITNKGGVEAPISVSTLSENKVIETTWHEGFRGTSTININSGNYDHIAIDAEGRMPELFSSNNTIRTKGLLKKTEPLRLKFGTRFEKREESQLYYLPAFGWNNYNKFMAGIILHNYSFLEKKFEFALMPLYSFGTRNIAGGGHVLLNLHPDSRLNRVSISAGLSRYAFLKDEYLFPGNEAATQLNTLHFTKADFKIILNFLPRFRQKHISTKIILRDIFVSRDIPYFFNYRKQTKKINYLQAEYIMENLNPLEKNRQRVGVTYGDKFLYGFGEAEYFMCYGKKDKGFKIRGFAGGTSIPENGTSGIDYNMNLSGRDGQHDYLFDEVFLGRSERDGILSQQFVNDFAGFKAPTSFFLEASKWMGGINVSTTLPGLLPFRLFASAGTSDNAGISDQFGKISWEIGVDLPVIKDIFVVSFPFAYSDDIRYAIDKQKLNKGSLIRFELHINKLNPIHLLKSIDE